MVQVPNAPATTGVDGSIVARPRRPSAGGATGGQVGDGRRSVIAWLLSEFRVSGFGFRVERPRAAFHPQLATGSWRARCSASRPAIRPQTQPRSTLVAPG